MSAHYSKMRRQKTALHTKRQQFCFDKSFSQWSLWIQFLWFCSIFKCCPCTTVRSSYRSWRPNCLRLVLSSTLKLFNLSVKNDLTWYLNAHFVYYYCIHSNGSNITHYNCTNIRVCIKYQLLQQQETIKYWQVAKKYKVYWQHIFPLY